jgi:hypothetical protein
MNRNCFRTRIVWCLLVCAASPWGRAHAQGSLGGRVIDSRTQGPVAGASLTISLTGRIASPSVESDAQGEFRFPALGPGEYRLRVEAEDYLRLEYDFALKPRQPLLLTVELTPKRMGGAQTEVRSSLSPVDAADTGSSRLLTRSSLDEFPAPVANDLTTLTQYLAPGAVLSHDNFVHVRGNELSLHQFINGVSFLDNPHAHFSPPASPRVFESVNILTGGFPAEFGNRFGGVLDVVTRSGNASAGHGSASAGIGTVFHQDYAAEYGASKGRLGYYVFAARAESERFLNPPQPVELHDRGRALQSVVQLDYQGDKNLWKLLLMGSGSQMQLPNTDEEARLGRDASRRLRSQTAILTWQRVFSPRSLLATSAYQRLGSDRLLATTDSVTPFGEGLRSPLTAGLKTDFSYARGGHTFKSGVDLTWMRLQEAFTFDPREEEHEHSPEDEEHHVARVVPLMVLPFHEEEHGHTELEAFVFRGRDRGGLFGAYAQDRFSPFRNLTVDLGARWDQVNIVGSYHAVSPRVGLAYHFPNLKGVAHFNYNRFFVPPPVEYVVLASFLGNTLHADEAPVGNTRPYTQNYLEAGWKQELHPQIFVEFNAYRHRGRNGFENSEISNTRLFLPTNFDRAHAEGLEFALNIRDHSTTGLSGRLQYAAARATFYGPVSGGFPSESLLPGQRILPAFDQTHTGTATVFYRRPWRNVRTALNLRYGSGTPVETEGADGGLLFPRLPQHLTLDCSTALSLWKNELRRLDFEFDVTNLSNNAYRISKESETTPIQFAPRRVVLGRVAFYF